MNEMYDRHAFPFLNSDCNNAKYYLLTGSGRTSVKGRQMNTFIFKKSNVNDGSQHGW